MFYQYGKRFLSNRLDPNLSTDSTPFLNNFFLFNIYLLYIYVILIYLIAMKKIKIYAILALVAGAIACKKTPPPVGKFKI